MNALVSPVHGLVLAPDTKEEQVHNFKLKKAGVTKLFRRSNGKRPKSTLELAWEQIQEEEDLKDERSS